MQLGIDFGTTRTIVTVRDRGNFPVVGFEQADGSVVDHWPTVVATDGVSLAYGWDAIARLGDRRWTVVRSFKRLLATGGPNSTVEIGDRSLTLVEVLVGFLGALRRDVIERSNLVLPGVTTARNATVEAWVAVPAGAASAQRFVTIDAFRCAGFSVAGMLNEPSAAGLEYAHRYRKTLTAQREDVLVYDLGGGTFDASLVRMGDGSHIVRAHAGDNRLGGDDFDELLLEMVLDALGSTTAELPPAERTRVLELCRAHKEALTPNTRRMTIDLADVADAVDGAGPSGVATIDTAAYYERCAPLVDRSLEAVARILPPGNDGEGLGGPSLAGVYVVGGASDLPVVARRLRDVFGRRVKRSTYPSAAIAVGLAIAFEEDAPRISDRFSRTFGVFREAGDGRDVAFDAILTSEAELDRDGTELVRRYHPVHNLGCYRYAECDRLEGGVPVGDLLPWGVLRFPFDPSLREVDDLTRVPVRRLDQPLPEVEERYRVDRSGIVEVAITEVDSGFTRHLRFGSDPRAG